MSPLYESEVRDLVAILDALSKPMETDQPKTDLLYISAMEVKVSQVDGPDDLFKVWWDFESECFRVERGGESS